MGFFDNELEPGDDVLKPCPNCGEDRVYRTSDGIFDFSNGRIFAPVEYYCDSCGHMVDEDDVLKSYKEICSDNNDTEPPSILQKSADPDVSSIEHDELRKQVKDRIAEGWEIEEVDNSDRKVIMSTTKGGTIGGHALTALTTGGWTFGAGNIAYSKLSKKRNSERVVVRPKEDLPADVDEPSQITDISEKLRDLKELKDEGVITEEEFRSKKQDLLDEY